MAKVTDVGRTATRALASKYDDIFMAPAVRSVAEAIDRMEAITSAIAASDRSTDRDGLACFNYLYTVITKRVQAGIDEGFFLDHDFLTMLDVNFANRYFDALRTYSIDPAAAPHVWAALMNERDERGIQPIQFAMAGVNAHINFDLAVAVVDTCTALRTQPTSGTQHADYQLVNDIFADEMQGLRRYYENWLQRAFDHAAAPVLNLICNWSVVTTRNSAWQAAERLWDLRRRGLLETEFVGRLDRRATLTSEVLLTPLY